MRPDQGELQKNLFLWNPNILKFVAFVTGQYRLFMASVTLTTVRVFKVGVMRIDVVLIGTCCKLLIASMTRETILRGHLLRRHRFVAGFAFSQTFHMTISQQLVCRRGACRTEHHEKKEREVFFHYLSLSWVPAKRSLLAG